MWTRFEGDRHVTVAGWWDTSQGDAEGMAEGTGKGGNEAILR